MQEDRSHSNEDKQNRDTYSQMATQTVTRTSTSYVEQRASPVRFESIPNDDVFQTVDQMSHGHVTLAGEETYGSSYGQKGIEQLVHQHLNSTNGNQHGITQLAQRQMISTDVHHHANNSSNSGYEFDQLARQYGGSTDVHHHQTNNATISTREIDQLVRQHTGSTDIHHHHQMNNATISGHEMDRLANHQTISTALDHYPINQDPNPEHIRRGNQERITYRQDVAVRYLQPPTPPPPGPIIVREIRAPQAPEAPPLIIRRRPPVPTTPPPVIIREKPPMPPPIEPARIVNKYLPAPPPPPRRVIIEQQAPLPQKPQPVIIEKWLPYHAAPERRVIVQRAPPVVAKTASKNTIITYDAPQVDIVKNVRDLGTIRADPQTYVAQYGAQLTSSDYILNTMNRFGLGNNYTQMIEMQSRSRASATAMSSEHMSTNSYAEKSFTETIGNQYGYVEAHADEVIYPDGHRHVHSSYATSGEPIVMS